MIHQPACAACTKLVRIEPRMLAASTEPTMATPSDWPSWRLEEFMPEAMPAWLFGTPDITPLVIGELTMPVPTPNSPYVATRYQAGVTSVSRDRAALLSVSAAPAMTSGSRGPRRATIRPASGAQAAITIGIGSRVRPARSADIPRTSCKYRVDRNKNPAIDAIAQTAVRLAPANGTLRKKRRS